MRVIALTWADTATDADLETKRDIATERVIPIPDEAFNQHVFNERCETLVPLDSQEGCALVEEGFQLTDSKMSGSLSTLKERIESYDRPRDVIGSKGFKAAAQRVSNSEWGDFRVLDMTDYAYCTPITTWEEVMTIYDYHNKSNLFVADVRFDW